jgi:hypothetical protein
MTPIVVGLAGLVAVPAFLVYFAIASRWDMLSPFAPGPWARWARRAAGVSVFVADHPLNQAPVGGRGAP